MGLVMGKGARGGEGAVDARDLPCSSITRHA